MKFAKLLYLTIILSGFAFCKEESKYDDDYARVILLQLAMSNPSATASCSAAITRNTECFALSMGVPTSSIALSDAAKEAQCNNLKQTTFNNMSERAQACLFDCQEKDWGSKINSGSCKTQTTTALLASVSTSTDLKTCIRSCIQTTDNQVNDSEINNLLLYNFIQIGE